jgi:hypothetical protein
MTSSFLQVVASTAPQRQYLKVKCGRQGQLCEPESDTKKPESHPVGVRASLDPNSLSIAQAGALSIFDGLP